MYDSCRPTIISAINLLNSDPSFNGHMNSNTHHKRSLLPFLGDALRWLTGAATTKDINGTKEHVNQFIDNNLSGSKEDLKRMQSHIEETLPSTLHLPVSSEDNLHFYQYLPTHVLITDKQFLLLIDVPIQDRSQQLSIYKIFTSDIPHGIFTACYNISTQYLGIMQDETMAVEISPQQF